MQITLERTLEIPGRGFAAAIEDFRQSHCGRSRVWHPGRFKSDSRVRRQADHKKINGTCDRHLGDAAKDHSHLDASPPGVMVNSIGMRLKLIQPGTFLMGSAAPYSSKDEQRVHQVNITQAFNLGVYQVTQAEYELVVGENPSKYHGETRPVESVSWADAQTFCAKLSAREKAHYRLPTEAEWEFACRAGSTSEYCFGESSRHLSDYAWHAGNSGQMTHPVGTRKPNAWGFYDLHGNLWEWCADWRGDYPVGEVTDPQGPSSGWYRVARGGSWYSGDWRCRSAFRYSYGPDYRLSSVGFRLVLAPHQGT